MRAKDTVRCTNCRRLQARVDVLEAELAALKQVVAQLSQQLAAARKDSSTSSKPPSCDIVKPPKSPPQGQDRRRIGGQPDHPKHERAAFPPEAINGGAFDHRIDSCPLCGHGLRPALTIPPRVVQQVDIREVALSVQEHRSHPGWCPSCQKMHEAPLPPGIARGGLVGPSLTALIAYLKGACHASYSTVRKFLRDVVQVTISRGELARIIAKVSRALDRPYEQLLDDLPGQARLNVDETGHKQNGDRQWTWCFRAGLYTLFKIDPTRSADVLIEVLGAEFDGVLGCDDFSSYRRYQREFDVLLQFCLAHVIKDINAPILDAVRRMRKAMNRRGKAGRKRKRGRKGAKSRAAAARRGMTVKEKASFVFKRRYLIVKRRENLTESQRDDLQRMLEYLPELTTLRRFADRTYWLFDAPKDFHRASCRRALIVRDPASRAVPELAKALDRLDEERFAKLMAYLTNPVIRRVRTNNHVERTNRMFRLLEKVRYQWRSRRALVRFVVLTLDAIWREWTQAEAKRTDPTKPVRRDTTQVGEGQRSRQVA